MKRAANNRLAIMEFVLRWVVPAGLLGGLVYATDAAHRDPSSMIGSLAGSLRDLLLGLLPSIF